MSIRTHAMMMIRFPFKPASINCLGLLILFIIAFILLDVLMNKLGSFKLFCYDKCLLHGLHPCVAVIEKSGSASLGVNCSKARNKICGQHRCRIPITARYQRESYASKTNFWNNLAIEEVDDALGVSQRAQKNPEGRRGFRDFL